MPEPSSLYVLAIDLGTSGPKAALFSTRGDLVHHTFEPTRLLLLPDGGAEQDPEDWWSAIRTATRRLLRESSVPADRIAAVSVTAQWSGTVAVDRSGRHLMNAVIWMDSRGAPHVRRITDGLLTFDGYSLRKLPRWIRLTGGIPSGSGKDPVAHILYIRSVRPDVYEKTHKFLEPKDYINLRLTGLFAASYDSIALHWVTDNRDLAAVRYDGKLLGYATLDPEKLPDLGRAVDVLGPLRPEVAEELGLGRDVKVILGTPDVQSAAVGSGAVRDYEGHLYIGTSSWITCHVPFKKTDILHNMACLPSALPDRYFIANEQETAGGCLNHLRDNILYPGDGLSGAASPPDILQTLDRIAEGVPPGSGRLIFMPWLYGERTPVEDRYVRGGFFNQSLNTTREHMIRAVYEGVAYNARWLLGCVERFVKRPFPSLNMIGGGARSDVWCAILADVLDRPIRQAEDPILANARGAAFLAAVALGRLRVEEIPERVRIRRTFEPDPVRGEIYNELYREFRNLYKANRKIFARLNRVGSSV